MDAFSSSFNKADINSTITHKKIRPIFLHLTTLYYQSTATMYNGQCLMKLHEWNQEKTDLNEYLSKQLGAVIYLSEHVLQREGIISS
jgi:hypothetical protein